MKSIINWLSKAYFANRKYKYTHEEILSYQDDFLVDLMISNKDTFVGKKYNFEDVIDYDSFKKNIPVFHYDDYKEYIYMSVKWQQNIICSDDIDFWAKTSGTTNDYQKYIPVTKRYLHNNHYKWWKDTISNYVNCNPDTKLFEWKWITIWWAMSQNQYIDKDNIWNISAIIQINNNILVDLLFTEPSQEISFLSDWNSKLDMIINTCKDKNITSTIWVTSRSLYLLKQLLVSQNKNFVDEIWPSYELFLTGGMDYKPLSKNIHSLFKKSINIRQVYNTCEWYIWSQCCNDDNNMYLLLCHDIYYEFLNWEDYKIWNFDNIANTYNISNNIEYVLVITNSCGLYRYIIWDIIKFININCFEFTITWRTKAYLDSFSEHVRENHTNTVIYFISQKYNILINDYHVWTIMNNMWDWSGCHHRIIELDFDIHNDNTLSESIDLELQKNNMAYNHKRSWNMLIQKPVVQIVPKWTFTKWFASKWKLWWQNKIPKLRNDDKIIKEINNLL